MDPKENALAVAKVLKCQSIVRDVVLEYVRAAGLRTDLTPTQVTATGLLDRVACWLITLPKLDAWSDYQAFACAFRALLELATDLAFLNTESTANEQIEAWELSARYKHAQQSLKENATRATAQAGTFVTHNATNVQQARDRFWSGKHPNRWTGRGLDRDVKLADAKFPKLGVARAYAEMHATLCWQVHGSGLVLARGGTEMAVSVTGAATIMCGKLAFACVELAGRLIDGFPLDAQRKVSDARRRWQERIPPQSRRPGSGHTR